MNTTPCAKCGSEKIIPQAKVLDYAPNRGGKDLEVEVSISHKKSFLNHEAFRAAAYARICAGCGHIELYTDHTEGLWEAYQESLKRK
jgi:hypothetical protein